MHVTFNKINKKLLIIFVYLDLKTHLSLNLDLFLIGAISSEHLYIVASRALLVGTPLQKTKL